MHKEAVINKLIEMGYFKYVPPEDMDKALDTAKDSLDRGLLSVDFEMYSKTNILASIDRRGYGIDGEELAEGGILDMIKKMEPVLKAEHVSITQLEQDIWNNNGYTVSVNGKEYIIYREDDTKNQNIWTLALAGLMTILNDLFISSNSDQRIYATHSGNDGAIYVLTDDLYKYLINNKINTSDYSVLPKNIDTILADTK